MASAQETVVMNAQDKEIVEKMVEVAKNIGMKQNYGATANSQQQNSAVVSMMNSTPGRVSFSTNQDWHGEVMTGEYPSVIDVSKGDSFTHSATDNDGSKGAVVYLGNNSTAKSCAWLLAWSAPKFPTNNNPNKVYVKCGDATDFQNINWNQIEASLNVSSTFSSFMEPITKTTCSANILPGKNFASVGANFGTM